MLNKNDAEGVQDEAFGTNKDKYEDKYNHKTILLEQYYNTVADKDWGLRNINTNTILLN